MSSLADAIAGFDPDLPIDETGSPPADWYTRGDVHDLEQRAVFARRWVFACRTDEVAEPGRWVAGRYGALPFVVVRGADGVLRAFHNSCRHRGSEVVVGAGCGDQLVCRYHGWRYRLDGSGKGALPPLAVGTWGPLVLVNADPDARPLGELTAGMDRWLDEAAWADLRWVARKRYEVRCNWKAFCDNYLDGGYHIAHVHETLDAQLDMSTYRTELGPTWSVQTSAPGSGDDERARVDVAARMGRGATYAFLYPALMLNRYGPVLDSNIVIALAPDRCEVLLDFWFEASVADDEAFVAQSLEQSHVTQLEDIDISESVQVGTASPAFDSGRYAPKWERAIHHFHQLVARDLRARKP